MSLTVLSDNLSPGPLWSSSWPWTLNFILHAFLHPIIIIFSQHMPIPTQPVLLQYQCSLSSLLGSLSFNLTPHIHLTILISARWSATTFSFLTGQVSLPCSMLLRTQLLYNLPLIIKGTSLLVSSGTSCLNLFQPIRIQASTAASASQFLSKCKISPLLPPQIFCLDIVHLLVSPSLHVLPPSPPHFNHCRPSV